MSNAVFPVLPGLTWKGTKTPNWSGIVQRAVSGMELRGTYYQYPLWKWTLTYDFLRAYGAFTEYQTLADFFNARQGSYDSFLYTDPSDSVIPDTAPYMAFGTGDGVTVAFQLGRKLITGGFFEPLYNVNGAIKVYVNGVLKTGGGVDYTLSAAGLVTFSAAPAGAAVVAWSGAYYWRCRFEQSAMEFANFASNFWALNKVEFTSIKGS